MDGDWSVTEIVVWAALGVGAYLIHPLGLDDRSVFALFLAYVFGREVGSSRQLRRSLDEQCRAAPTPNVCGRGQECPHHPGWVWVDGPGFVRRDQAERDAARERFLILPRTSAKKKAEAGAGRSPEPRPEPTPDGWICPDHGKVVQKHSARTGRDYLACPVAECIEIERR